MKKTLGILSLVMLLLSTFMTPLTYAEATDLTGDNLTDELSTEKPNINELVEDEQNEEVQEKDGSTNNEEQTNEEGNGNPENIAESTGNTNNYEDKSGSSSGDKILELDLNENNGNNENIEVLSNQPDIDWESCFQWNGQYIKKYLCDYTEIIIPENASGVYGEAFAGKTIENITFLSSDTVIFQQIFSGAVLQGKMTLPGNNRSQGYMLEGAIVGEEGEITLNQGMRTYHSTILGKVIVDGTKGSYNYLFQNSFIDGEVILSGFSGKIDQAFYGSTLTENGKIIIGEGPNEIYNSFQRTNQEGELLGTIIFPESLEKIGQSFYGIPINTHIKFPKGLKSIQYSFYERDNYPVIFQSGLQFSGNQELNIEYSFNDVEIDGDFSTIGSGITLKYFAPRNVSGDVIISGENVYLKDGTFYSYQSGGSKINGNVIISGNNIGEMRGFSNAKIGEDFKVFGNSINLNYSLGSQPNIGGDVIIYGNSIEAKYGALTTMNLSGDFVVSGNNIDFEYASSPMNIDGDLNIKGNNVNIKSSFYPLKVMGNVSILGDNIDVTYSSLSPSNVNGSMDIKGNEINIMYSSMQGLSILGELNIIASGGTISNNALESANIGSLFTLSGDYEYGTNILNNLKAQKFIIEKPISNVLSSITGDLIINNADNAVDESFSGVKVSNNIYLNGEISKVGASAYAFSSGNIQPITLSANFNTGDIGENAFCVNGNPVIAYTMKVVSQADRNYLLEHSCLDIKSAFNISFNVDGNVEIVQYNGRNIDDIPNPSKPGYEFIGWFEENSEAPFDFANTTITEDKTFYAHWKALEEKAQETTSESVVYTNETTVTIGDDIQEETINNSSSINLVSKEVETEEVKSEEEKITVQESEIQVTSDKTVEYQGGLEVYLEKTENVGTENETTERIEGTAKFSSPVAVKIPIYSNAETVKVQVKHEGEEFGYKGLTTNPVNSCSNGEAVSDKYNGENILVKNVNGEKYVLIYTCSASTFVAYTENTKPVNNTTTVSSPAAGGGRTITSTKNEINTVEQEHNSADLDKTSKQENYNTTSQTNNTPSIGEQVKKIEGMSLTRGEVAVMTNILLDVYPQLTEKRELNEVSEACEKYSDEQNFTKDEKKAITRLCKLSIMGIHNDNEKPLDEFMVNEITKNDEFSKVINRSLSTYTEKDFSVVKDALKKLEGDEDNVVFGTVYDLFMSIKNIFG